MSEFHDLRRQINYLKQMLRQDKKPLGFLIGAGCPMSIPKSGGDGKEPLIPDIARLTYYVQQKMEDSPFKSQYAEVCKHFKDAGNDNPNIEIILSYLRMLREVCGKTEIRGLTGEDIDGIEAEICNEIKERVEVSLIGNETPYHKFAAWVGSIQRNNSVEIFTTNYDLLMEQSLEEMRIPYFDGFIGSRFSFFDPYAIEEDVLPSRWARLWKLHGSINWHIDDKKRISRGPEPDTSQGLMIHPSHLKYDESRRMPYLALMDRLKQFLKQPSAGLIICGYSFSDIHINDVIQRGLQGNATAVAFANMYNELQSYSRGVKLASKCGNLSLLAKDGGVIGTKNLNWLKIEKDDTSLKADSNCIKLVKDKTEFGLGNFESLGAFLADLIGYSYESSAIGETK